MKKCLILFLSFALIMLTSFTTRPYKDVINYYGVSKTINFNKLTYNLAWSSHPDDGYYKQEYIPSDNAGDSYKDLILIDFMIGKSVSEAVATQVVMLKDRKKVDEVCNYQILANEKTGEYILDFLMSKNDVDNSIGLIEWDGYHYETYTDSLGHKGVLLFGVSHRAYGNYTMPFMKSLKNYRDNSLKALNEYQIPNIQIK